MEKVCPPTGTCTLQKPVSRRETTVNIPISPILALVEVKMAVLEMLREKQRSSGPGPNLIGWRSLEKWHDMMEVICPPEFLSVPI